MQQTLKETNLRWIGYAYFAVGVFAFVLLHGHPLVWLRFAFIALSLTAAWYFILFQSGQRLWIENSHLCWTSRSGGMPHSGHCAVQSIHQVVLYRFNGRRKDDGLFTRVALEMRDGTLVPLPTGLRLGEGRFAQLEDVMEALRVHHPRLVVKVAREAPDFELWDQAASTSTSDDMASISADKSSAEMQKAGVR